MFHTARTFTTGVPHYAYGLSLEEDVRHYTLCEALINVSPVPVFKALKDDPLPTRHRVTLKIGDVKNE